MGVSIQKNILQINKSLMLWKRRFFYTSLFAIWLGANLPTIGFAYQQNWFINYIENWNQTTADCQTQCIIVGKTIETDNARIIKGEVNGQWAIIIGTLINNQFQSQKQLIIQDTQILNETIQLQWDKNSLAAIVVNGSVKRQDLTTQQTYLTIIEKIGNWRKQFRTMDTFKPYTINLLYGPRINGKSANIIFYIIALIGLLATYITTTKKKEKIIISTAIVLIFRITYDIRMTAEFTQYTYQNYHDWVKPDKNKDKNYKKIYGNFPSFTQSIKTIINDKKIKTIYFKTNQDRPLKWYITYDLYPTKISNDPKKADAIITWNSDLNSEEGTKEIVIEETIPVEWYPQWFIYITKKW